MIETRAGAARENRREMVAKMIDRGMTPDAVAGELGFHCATVRSDLKAMGYEFRRGCRGGEWIRSGRVNGLVNVEAHDKREWSACNGVMWSLPCNTRDDALDEVDHPTEVGRVQWYWPTVDAVQVIEALEQDACDFAGEYVEEWLGDLRRNSPEVTLLQEMLQETVEAWMKKTKRMPAFFRVHDVEPVGEEAPC